MYCCWLVKKNLYQNVADGVSIVAIWLSILNCQKWRQWTVLTRLLILAATATYLVDAADKSGVSPNTISVPKGPGSIEGMGETFQPSLNTGTAKYRVPIHLPPGIAGHVPQISLIYEGGGGNGPLGFGWQLPVAYIQRQTDKGIPRYVDAPNDIDDDLDGIVDNLEELDTFINESKEELVPRDDGFFFSKNEGAFIRYRPVGEHWEGTLPDGTLLEFGLSQAARISDAQTGRVFSWLVERMTDTHGNVIRYTYRSFTSQENLNQRYLTLIEYGPGSPPWEAFHFISFTYEDRFDWFEDCRPGFPLHTGKRLREISVCTQGPILANHLQADFNGDGTPDNLVRSYQLGYWRHVGVNSHWSYLASVTQIGADGTNALPASRFGYSICDPPETVSAEGKIIGGLNEPPFVMDNPLVDLVDLNGDGVPDILKTDQGGGAHRAYLNLGETNSAVGRFVRWSVPAEVASADGLALGINLQSGSQSSENIAHLADMDGDGMADLVYRTPFDSVYYFKNLGSSSWAKQRPMSVQDDAPPSPFGSTSVKTADLDFNKSIDIIQSVAIGGSAGYRIWFNLENGRYSHSKTVTKDDGFLFSAMGVDIADLNGDRVADICKITPKSVQVISGLGYGHFLPLRAIPIPDYTLDSTQIDRARLQDITGDGLADLVIERAEPQTLWYWINLGNYTFSQRKVITNLPRTPFSAVIRWADINGNGTTDYIVASKDNEPRIQAVDLGYLLGRSSAANLLERIDNGIGRVTELQYLTSSQFALKDSADGHPWPDPLPFPVSVVSRVTTSDSRGHIYSAEFRYHDGYYDSAEKQFRGFARVEQVDVGDAAGPTLVVRSHFDTGRDFEVMKGKLLRLTTEQTNGSSFSDEFTTWTRPPVTLYTGTNGLSVYFAHPISRTNIIRELGNGLERRLESEMGYDNYGNQIYVADYGIVENGDHSAFNDERITTTEFSINTTAWLLNAPKRSEIRSTGGAVISRSEFFYDDETFGGSNLGEVTIGNLTMRREWIDPAKPDAFITSVRTKYDAFGNPVTFLDPQAPAPGGVVDLGKGHAREIAYDRRFHMYPVIETIHLSEGKEPLIFQAAYDEGFGTVASSTDFNANNTFYGYDTFARLVSLVKPGDSAAFPSVEYDYALAVPTDYWSADGLVRSTGVVNYVETRQLDKDPSIPGTKSDHYLLARQFVDGLGRNLLSKQEAESAPGSTVPRVVVTAATQFNARQKPARVLNPFFTLRGGSLGDLLAFEDIEAPGWQGQFHNEGSLVTLDLASAHGSLTDYDATLRPTQITNPDGTQRRTVYEPLLIRSFDESDTDSASPFFDTPMVHSNDGLGRLIRVDETSRLNDDGTPARNGAATPVVWTTRYKYDLNDQLTRITDSQNNVKTFTYDGLKRKTDMNDPDRGVMHFVYDDASNLTETTDAKGQTNSYTYDGVNRIRTEKYHDGLPLPSWRSSRNKEARTNSVIYHYDTPVASLPQGDNTVATARNVKGALAWVEDLSGEEHTSYDARGRVEWVVKRIPDPLITDHGALVSYGTKFAYDSLDRLTNLTYPDADQIRYEYNDRNLLQSIPGGFTGGQAQPGNILSNLRYLPSGQMAQIDYGNGVRTTYAYDSRLRLKNLLTVSQSSTLNQQLINFAYDFDGVSNIKSIADLRPGSAVPAGDPRRNSQLFHYDDLYRLTRVEYSFALPGAASRNDGEINYRYDRIGNMLAQTSTLNHREHGLPVANLGQMDSGGSAGRWNRTGRAPSDPPGPHALTSIIPPGGSPQGPNNPRVYPYDSNGNMTNIDGLICTWDFKGRLVVVENAEMRAAYTYDYTDRRITKRVAWKSGYPLASDGNGAGGEGTTTVSYISKYFEVREHDAPTKYVWNGNTRVARVTGSLNTNVRIQRLRVHPGWNLCSFAVNGPLPAFGGDGQGELVSSAFKWNATSRDWQPIALGASQPAGAVLWLQATATATLAITGTYADPTNRTVTASGDFLPSAGLEAWYILSTISNQPSTTLWNYDAMFTRWVSWLPPPLELQSDLPAFLAPGQAVFALAASPAQLEVPDFALRIRYYHQDHLGSSSFVTDGEAAQVAGTAFYPFGSPRVNTRPRGLAESYQYIQKERDAESHLDYFEARFLAAGLARFSRFDPSGISIANSWLQAPQHLHPYSYSLNSPVVFRDPNGQDAESSIRGVFGGMQKSIDDGAGSSVGSILLATTLSTATTVAEGIALTPFSLWDQGKAFGEKPNFETLPILGPTGVAIGETTAAAFADPSLVNVSKAVGAYTQGLGVALGGVQAFRSAGALSGSTAWPPNRGFLKPPDKAVLQPGSVVDRYGGSGGTFVAPKNTPFQARSLPANFSSKPLNAYEVVKPINVDAGVSAPWFKQPGGGVQFELPAPVQELLDSGHLRSK